MESKVNYTIVGAFVLILIAAIVLCVLWLSSGVRINNYKTYMVYMNESVTGLSVDAPVEFNGVNVGVIKSIKINKTHPYLIELLLNVKDDTPVTEGTRATLDTRGLTGLIYVELKDKGADLRPLSIKPGEPYPIIPATPSLLTRLDVALTNLADNFDEITKAIKGLLSPENQLSIRGILQHLDSFTAVLQRNAQSLNTFMQSSARAAHTLEIQTLPTTYQLLYNLDQVSRHLDDVSSQLKQNPSVIIRGARPAPLGPGETP